MRAVIGLWLAKVWLNGKYSDKHASSQYLIPLVWFFKVFIKYYECKLCSVQCVQPWGTHSNLCSSSSHFPHGNKQVLCVIKIYMRNVNVAGGVKLTSSYRSAQMWCFLWHGAVIMISHSALSDLKLRGMSGMKRRTVLTLHAIPRQLFCETWRSRPSLWAQEMLLCSLSIETIFVCLYLNQGSDYFYPILKPKQCTVLETYLSHRVTFDNGNINLLTIFCLSLAQ